MLQMQGEIFEAVQLAAIFPDSKTFVDSIPLRKEEDILADYRLQQGNLEFNLKNFVLENFEIAKPVQSSADRIETTTIEAYISSLWNILYRDPDQEVEGSSHIPLPYPYIVPGGRFREIYYWDSYFTCEGLAVLGRYDMIESMLKNFIYLQERIGFIPNGNRLYYVTRSQFPVLGLIIDILCRRYGLDYIEAYLPALERELQYWTSEPKAVIMLDGAILSRFYDLGDWPREEAYKQDFALAQRTASPQETCRHLRSAAESGFDFTVRWLSDPHDLATICTTEITPVCLNSIVYSMAAQLANYHKDPNKKQYYQGLADRFKKAINSYFWNQQAGCFFDYNCVRQKQTDIISMATAVPLFVKLATDQQAKQVALVIENKLLKKGGFCSSTVESGQQWDSPNGWAPLQWFGVIGLLNYGLKDLAFEAMRRWVQTMRDNFETSKCLLEKYNVVEPLGYVGGGEYAVQEGFGWTNGVAICFLAMLGSLVPPTRS